MNSYNKMVDKILALITVVREKSVEQIPIIGGVTFSLSFLPSWQNIIQTTILAVIGGVCTKVVVYWVDKKFLKDKKYKKRIS